MADIYTKFTAADQAVAFGLTWFAASIHASKVDREMMAGCMMAALPNVTKDHPMMMKLMGPAESVVRSVEAGEAGLGGLQFDVAHVTAEFTRWRTGVALDAMRQMKGRDK